jgi:hypothetical protein
MLQDTLANRRIGPSENQPIGKYNYHYANLYGKELATHWLLGKYRK